MRHLIMSLSLSPESFCSKYGRHTYPWNATPSKSQPMCDIPLLTLPLTRPSTGQGQSPHPCPPALQASPAASPGVSTAVSGNSGSGVDGRENGNPNLRCLESRNSNDGWRDSKSLANRIARLETYLKSETY